MKTDNTSYSLADKTRNINEWYRRTASWIWESSADWEWDDSNYTTLPNATTALAAGQQDYELPSTAQKIERVEVKNSDGDYMLIAPLDKSQVNQAMTEFWETNGMPIYYDLVGRSVLLYPAPATAANR